MEYSNEERELLKKSFASLEEAKQFFEAELDISTNRLSIRYHEASKSTSNTPYDSLFLDGEILLYKCTDPMNQFEKRFEINRSLFRKLLSND